MKTHRTCSQCVAHATFGTGTPYGKARLRPGHPLALALACLLLATQAPASLITWTGSSGTDTKWSNAGNWDLGVPGVLDDAVLSTNGLVADTSVNNVLDFSPTVNSLTYSPISTVGSPYYQNTLIDDGQTLSVVSTAAGNAVFVGSGSNSIGLDTLATLSGPNATFSVIASNGNFNVRQGGLSHYAGTASLDMSGVSNATITVRNVLIGGDGSNASPFDKDRPGGTLKLAQNTTLNVLSTTAAGTPGVTAAYTIGNSSQVPGSLVLGQTNYIYCDSGMAFGLIRCRGQLGFNNLFPTPYAKFRGLSGTSRQSQWLIGDNSLGGAWGGLTMGTVDFTFVNGYIDALVDQVVLGRSINAANTDQGNTTTGTLSFDGGILDVNTLVVGYQMQDYCSAAVGTLNVNSTYLGPAQLLVNSSLQLGRFMGADSTNGVSSAILNINGGIVSVNGNITTATSALNPVNDSEINNQSGGTLYVKGTVGPLYQLTLGSGSTNTFDLGTSVNPLAPLCTVTNLNTAYPVYLNVQGSALDLGTIQVIKYASYGMVDLSDFVPSMPLNVFGYFTNNTATMSIDLVVTNTAVFSWNGLPNGNWDVGGTANWKSGAAAVIYDTGHNAQFDDSAQGTTTINMVSNIPPPTTIFKNTTKTYTLSGAGALTGTGGLTKSGSGKVTIANGNNAFSGPLTLNAGTVQLSGGADRLPTNCAVTLANVAGVVLDVNGQSQTLASLTGGGSTGGEVKLGDGTLTIGGTASATYNGLVSGTGRLVKTNTGALYLAGANTYSGGTVISNGTLYAINTSGSALGSGFLEIDGGQVFIGNNNASGLLSTPTITNNTALYGGSASLVLNRNDDFTFTNYLTGNGQLQKNNANTVTIATANSYKGYTTISAGALRIAHPNALGTPNLDGRNWDTVVSGGSGSTVSARLELSNNITVAENLLLASKTGASPYNPSIRNVHGSNTLTGTITWTTGGTYYYLKSEAGSKLVLGNPSLVAYSSVTGSTLYWQLGGDGDGDIYCPIQNGYNSVLTLTNAVLKDGKGTWTLYGVNTYIGPTTISNGTLVVNGVVAGGGRLGNSPSGLILSDCNVFANATLRGYGRILQAVTNYGVLAPGTASSVGTLAVSNYLTLATGSTNVFRLGPGLPACDQVVGITTATYGGDLKVVLSGTLFGGEVFKLFGANTYQGSFDTLELPTLPAPLSWDTTQLGVDGTLRVNGSLGTKSASFASFGTAADKNFQATGLSTMTNWGYRVLATTNLTDPLSWMQVGNGYFTGGTFSFTDLGSTNYPQRFYQVVAP